MEYSIGDICDYYGGLYVKEDDGKYFWGIADWDRTEWSEIPEYLYNELLKYRGSQVEE